MNWAVVLPVGCLIWALLAGFIWAVVHVGARHDPD
jgi:hypothetical protein